MLISLNLVLMFTGHPASNLSTLLLHLCLTSDGGPEFMVGALEEDMIETLPLEALSDPLGPRRNQVPAPRRGAPLWELGAA